MHQNSSVFVLVLGVTSAFLFLLLSVLREDTSIKMDDVNHKLSNMMKVLSGELETIITKADPLLSYLKRRIGDYSSKRKFAQVIIQGSVGNHLYFPEILKDGVYRIEIDMLFEQDSAHPITLPIWRAEEVAGVPQIRVEVVQDESTASPEYVKLKVVHLPELIKSDKEGFLELNEDFNLYFLKNSAYLNNLPSNLDEIEGGMMGEKEITGSDFFSVIAGRRPFRPFKTEQQTFFSDKETFCYRLLMDKVAAIKVKWPDFAIPWRDRKRRWPPAQACRDIIHNGIHVIPKSAHNSKSSTQWKYTFAIAEQSLARMFTPMQKACYLVLKQLKRKYFNEASLNDGSVVLTSGLSTHHLKTVMFWTSEKLDPDEWQANPGKCLRLLIQTLVEFLSTKQCPSYFAPEVNLFERLWMDESKFLYVKSVDELRDLRIHAALERVLEVQENIQKYLTRDLLEVVDEDHDRSESNAEYVENSMFGSWKFDTFKSLSLSGFEIDYRNLFTREQEEEHAEETETEEKEKAKGAETEQMEGGKGERGEKRKLGENREEKPEEEDGEGEQKGREIEEGEQ